MDKNLEKAVEMRINRTVEALRKNKMEAHYIAEPSALIAKLEELMPEGASCSSGGSVTLAETGVMDFLRSGKYNFLDRYAPGIDTTKVFHEALMADFYFMSSNAITEKGELYNIDGNGNRLAALVYGPKRVIVIAGANKIVKDLDEAFTRVKTIACPANALRLGKEFPCAITGVCNDCKTPGRFCCHTVISQFQVQENRICVLILPQSFGY
jgi:hypothetical protein